MTPEVRVLPELVPVVLQLIATAILFVVLRHYLFKPVSEFLNQRKEKIEGELQDAKAKQEEAASLKKQYQLKIDDAKKEGQEIVEASKKRGDQLREDIIIEAKKEAENLVERARTEISREKEKAVEDLKAEVVTIAMMAASKVIDKNLDEAAHREMIGQFINEVGESQWKI